MRGDRLLLLAGPYVFAGLALCASAPLARAQTLIRGTVTDSATGEPLAGVRVALVSGADLVTFTDPRGRYQLLVTGTGAFQLVATRIGYAPRSATLDRPEGAVRDLALVALGMPLDPVVVSASRSDEGAFLAPASVSVIDRDRIEEQTALTPVENIRAVTGIDLASKGLIQHTYALRGERGSISGAMLTLTDFRNADVPSIAVNVPYLMATSNEDLDHIEVVRGPGAALYGPGADRGVLHFITRSPFESPGGSLTVTGGGRELFEGTVRYAARLGRRLAFKVSADYVSGRDWSYTDPVEASLRAAAIVNGALPDTLRIGARNPNVARAGGELRVDWRPDANTELVTLAGVADAIHVVELGGDVGSVQASDWRYSYAQTRLRRGPFSANLFVNIGGTGDSYLLRNGHRLIDSSRVVVGQIQNGARLGPVDLVYGADLRWTDPRTGGTINGEHENNDQMTETGAYLHGTAALGNTVDLVGALRLDHHSRLDDIALSPRIGIVFRPAPNHAFRLTYNRAFTSPDANTLFLDLPQGGAPPYVVRASSVPQGGYSFRRDCGGASGLCMYSPFAPDPTAPLAVDGTALWQQLCSSGVVPQLCGIPAPNAAQVGTNLAALNPNTQGFDPISPAAVTDIGALRRTITNTVELGWKANVRERLALSADLYMNRVSDPIGARYGATPNAFYDSTTLSAYLTGLGVSASQATALAGSLSHLPLGTVSPSETTHPTDLLVLSRQGGAYNVWGLDLGVSARIGRTLSVDGNMSWLSRNVLYPTATDTTVLGVPEHKASLGITYRRPGSDFTAGLDVRGVEGFPIRTGLYSDASYNEHVRDYAVCDAHVGFRLPGWTRTSIVIAANNVFGNRHQEFVGAPPIGRLLLTRLRTEF